MFKISNVNPFRRSNCCLILAFSCLLAGMYPRIKSLSHLILDHFFVNSNHFSFYIVECIIKFEELLFSQYGHKISWAFIFTVDLETESYKCNDIKHSFIQPFKHPLNINTGKLPYHSCFFGPRILNSQWKRHILTKWTSNPQQCIILIEENLSQM